MSAYVVNKCFSTIRYLFLLSSAGNTLAPLTQALFWGRVESRVEDNHTVCFDELTADVDFWENNGQQEFLELWKQCRQYKRQPGEQKVQSSQRPQRYNLQQSNSQVECYAGYQSKHPALEILPSQSLKVLPYQRKKTLSGARQSDLQNLRTLPSRNKKLTAGTEFHSLEDPSRWFLLMSTIRQHILRCSRQCLIRQCISVLKRVYGRDGDLGAYYSNGKYFPVGVLSVSRFFLSLVYAPDVHVSLLYPDSKGYSIRGKTRC